jgi:hypothetical protein
MDEEFSVYAGNVLPKDPNEAIRFSLFSQTFSQSAAGDLK